jgi:DNA-binding transcriptional LysR family regulator
MELRHLRYFAAVAEELNYRKAAERLRVAQPALSSQIKDLEHEIGVRLLDRDTGGVQLTDAGAAFLVEVRLILAHAQRAVAVAHEAAKGRRGRLTVGYFAPLLLGLIPAALKSFHEEFPDVEVTLAEMPLGEQLAALESGAIQIGFSVGGSGPIPRGLKNKKVASTPIRAVIGRSHRLARVKAIGLADLAQERLLSFLAKKDAPSVHGAIMRERFAARGIKTGPIREIEGPEAFRATLESGQGVSLIAELSSFSRSWDLVFKPLKETGADLFVELHALWRADQTSQLTANFIAHLSRIKPPVRLRSRQR